jgi:hypothetical protein
VDEPRPAAVAFVTTEHFTLQGARSQAISESTGRASISLVSVSGGLVALGLVATAAVDHDRVGIGTSRPLVPWFHKGRYRAAPERHVAATPAAVAICARHGGQHKPIGR